MNIKFSKGKTRGALILGPIVIKFISLDSFIRFIGDIFSLIGEKNYFKVLKGHYGLYRFRIIRALFANITEFFTWKTSKAPFLAPTYFSCGFFNIQKTITGKPVVNNFEVYKKIYEALPDYRKRR
jgi:hypothetical protein